MYPFFKAVGKTLRRTTNDSKTEDRGRRTGDRGRRTEDGRQRKERCKEEYLIMQPASVTVVF